MIIILIYYNIITLQTIIFSNFNSLKPSISSLKIEYINDCKTIIIYNTIFYLAMSRQIIGQTPCYSSFSSGMSSAVGSVGSAIAAQERQNAHRTVQQQQYYEKAEDPFRNVHTGQPCGYANITRDPNDKSFVYHTDSQFDNSNFRQPVMQPQPSYLSTPSFSSLSTPSFSSLSTPAFSSLSTPSFSSLYRP